MYNTKNTYLIQNRDEFCFHAEIMNFPIPSILYFHFQLPIDLQSSNFYMCLLKKPLYIGVSVMESFFMFSYGEKKIFTTLIPTNMINCRSPYSNLLLNMI